MFFTALRIRRCREYDHLEGRSRTQNDRKTAARKCGLFWDLIRNDVDVHFPAADRNVRRHLSVASDLFDLVQVVFRTSVTTRGYFTRNRNDRRTKKTAATISRGDGLLSTTIKKLGVYQFFKLFSGFEIRDALRRDIDSRSRLRVSPLS